MAIEEPVTTMLIAVAAWRSPAMRQVTGVAMDQKTAWAAATRRRAATSSGKLGAAAEATCPAKNVAITTSMRRFISIRDPRTMSGTESSMTAHA